MNLGKYSFGVGDRFGHQGNAQLQAMVEAESLGVHITPVWNKSYREHKTIGTHPADVRREADQAVADSNWRLPYFVDADHVGLKTVDLFVESSDFFTLDVADSIGKPADRAEIDTFVTKYSSYTGSLQISGISEPFEVNSSALEAIAGKYLFALKEAGRIYRHVAEKKGKQAFIVEVSMDETEFPQTPLELFFILAAIADEKIPTQTIAPKFTGRFNKGVDYIGDLKTFAREFEQDLAVIAFAVQEFTLPVDLKLSVHSGSDKFALYPLIRNGLLKFDAGLHLKTAGTTWLEELIGLAEGGEEGLTIGRLIYRQALSRYDELCGPYETVIDIDRDRLPEPDTVDTWTGLQFSSALRHDQTEPQYNSHFRQLLHVAYKIAAEMGGRYLDALIKYEKQISRNVTKNILEGHVKPLFL